jgi:N-acetylated-alpha-linked acidic dipeptidase
MVGDISTPGYPAYENATRINATAAPDIPVIPISWLNAQTLLRELEDGGRRVRVMNHGKFIIFWMMMGNKPCSTIYQAKTR